MAGLKNQHKESRRQYKFSFVFFLFQGIPIAPPDPILVVLEAFMADMNGVKLNVRYNLISFMYFNKVSVLFLAYVQWTSLLFLSMVIYEGLS